MIYIGVDLGLRGGLAYIDDKQMRISQHDYISLPECFVMPPDDVGKFLLLQQIATITHKGERKYEPCVLFMEDIQMYTNQAINAHAYKSLFQEMGKFLAWGVALNFPVRTVAPREWQRDMNCLTLSGRAKKEATAGLGLEEAKAWEKEFDSKGLALRECKKLFPGINLIPPNGRVPHNGIVDAVLIAEWGRRLMKVETN